MEKERTQKGFGFEDCDVEIDTGPSLDMYFKYTNVNVIDGVLVAGDNEQIKLLFYYIILSLLISKKKCKYFFNNRRRKISNIETPEKNNK